MGSSTWICNNSQITNEPKKNGSNDERGDFVNKMKKNHGELANEKIAEIKLELKKQSDF